MNIDIRSSTFDEFWSQRPMTEDPQFLFIGAHPDDIEIGAGGLLRTLISRAEDVHALILTDDTENAETRRTEARRALEHLGLRRAAIHFAGMRDGDLTVNAGSVARVRAIAAESNLRPDVIVVHTASDSHNDHVAANKIAHAAFRGATILHFAIHLSVELSSFSPVVFCELSDDVVQAKDSALMLHSSQRDRIARRSLEVFELAQAMRASLIGRTEAFEVAWQETTPAHLPLIESLNSSAFHRLWSPLRSGGARITVLYEGFDRPGAPIDWPTTHESIGRDALRDTFSRRWFSTFPLSELPANSDEALRRMDSGPVVLVGGAVSNKMTREFYNRLASVGWVIEYEIPRNRHAFVLDRRTTRVMRPQLVAGDVVIDYGLITRVRHPSTGFQILLLAGCTGRGTRAALEWCANPSPVIVERLNREETVELVFRFDARTKDLSIVPAEEVVDEWYD
jgi:LmbE family N-acetylglucosaminyl deacetylase